jgi:AcrR family transcriptional regulator
MRLRRAEQVERNHDAVLAAARRVFLERGYSGASLEAIADEAGFSKGVVYSQFKSKADLFFALLERRIEERAADNQRIAGQASGPDALRALLHEAARDGAAGRDWARVLVEFRAVAGRDARLNERYARTHERTVQRLAHVLVSLFEREGLAPPASPRSLAEFVLAVGSGVTLEHMANPDALPREDLTRTVMRALGMPPTEDGSADD